MIPVDLKLRRAPDIQRLNHEDDLDTIQFTDGVAAVEVSPELLQRIAFKNDARTPSDRLRRVADSIRQRGYQPIEPIVARIGRRGRWVIVDGGHRLTAARRISREFWTNLFRKKIRSLYFILYETGLSNTKPPRRRKRLRAAKKR